MAIWQVVCFLRRQTNTLRFDELFSQSLQKLAKTFPEEKSWSTTIKQYGACDSTCIEIEVSCNKFINSIYLRVDLRNITHHQLKVICDFANENGLVLQHENVLYDVAPGSFAKIFKKSSAYKFLNNPEEFLQSRKNTDD